MPLTMSGVSLLAVGWGYRVTYFSHEALHTLHACRRDVQHSWATGVSILFSMLQHIKSAVKGSTLVSLLRQSILQVPM